MRTDSSAFQGLGAEAALTATAAQSPRKKDIRKDLLRLFERQFKHNEINSSYLALMIQFHGILNALELGVLKPPENTTQEEYQRTVKAFIGRTKKEAQPIQVKANSAAMSLNKSTTGADLELHSNVPQFFEAQKEDWQNSRKIAVEWNAFYKLKPLR